MSNSLDKLLETAQTIVDQARSAGADVAEALGHQHQELSVNVRFGKTEQVEEAGSSAIGLRVIKNGCSSTTFTSDFSSEGLKALVEDALALAQLSESDPLSLPPDSDLLEKNPPDLDLYDEQVGKLDAAEAIQMAIEAETAALEADKRITNSRNVSVSRINGATALVTSDGFSHGYQNSYASCVVQPIADDADGKKQIGAYWDARRHLSDLQKPQEIGKEAALRTIQKLGSKKINTQELPVVFSPEAGQALLSLLCGCIQGNAIYQRQSYLADMEQKLIANSNIQIIDDPTIKRAPGSRPFDGEGLPSTRLEVIQDGILRSFLLDTYSARKLNKKSTGNATRSVGGRPSVGASNFILQPGSSTPDAIIQDVKLGLYVTSMMGFGFNAVTGDFSRGAEGFLIENGQKTQPVGEITISLNFLQLWQSIDAIANDLNLKSKISCPTFRVPKMTIAGN